MDWFAVTRRRARAVVVHQADLLAAVAPRHVGDLGVGDARLAGELQHHLVGDLVGEPARLRRRGSSIFFVAISRSSGEVRS